MICRTQPNSPNRAEGVALVPSRQRRPLTKDGRETKRPSGSRLLASPPLVTMAKKQGRPINPSRTKKNHSRKKNQSKKKNQPPPKPEPEIQDDQLDQKEILPLIPTEHLYKIDKEDEIRRQGAWSGKEKTKAKTADESDTDEKVLPQGKFEVQCITDCANYWGTLHLRTRWVGYGANSDTWEDCLNLADSRQAIERFTQYIPLFRNTAGHFLSQAKRTILRCLHPNGTNNNATNNKNKKKSHKRPDLCVLYTLTGRYIHEGSSWRDANKESVESTRKMLDNRVLSTNVLSITHTNPVEVFNEMARKLFISPFDLLDATLLHMSRHNARTRQRLLCYARLLCQSIKYTESLNEMPNVFVENWFDHEVPEDFEYIPSNVPVGDDVILKTPLTAEEIRERICNCGTECIPLKCSCIIGFDPRNPSRINVRPREEVAICMQSCECNCISKNITKFSNLGFTIFRTKERGWGLRAVTEIAKGQFVSCYVGEIFTESERDRRNSIEDSSKTYMLDVDFDAEIYTVDSKFRGNISRFINHSCDPNLIMIPIYDKETPRDCAKVAFFAARTIPPSEELTFDYSSSPLEEYRTPTHCVERQSLRTNQSGSAQKRSRKKRKRQLLPTPPPPLQNTSPTPGTSRNDSRSPSPETHTKAIQQCKCGSKLCRGFIF